MPIKDVMKRNVVCYEEETPALAIYEFLVPRRHSRRRDRQSTAARPA